jgi:DNA-binding NtrC family response regulator
MSGLELATIVRERVRGFPVLLMSGYAEELQAGASGSLQDAPLVAKPFSRERLLSEVEQVLARSRGRDGHAHDQVV